MSSNAQRPAADPARLSIEELARLLTSAGEQEVTAEQIREDVAAGAPTNSDGTIGLLAYAAWLARESD